MRKWMAVIALGLAGCQGAAADSSTDPGAQAAALGCACPVSLGDVTRTGWLDTDNVDVSPIVTWEPADYAGHSMLVHVAAHRVATGATFAGLYLLTFRLTPTGANVEGLDVLHEADPTGLGLQGAVGASAGGSTVQITIHPPSDIETVWNVRAVEL